MIALAMVSLLAFQVSATPQAVAQIELALKAKKEGRYEEAIQALRSVVTLEPGLWAAHASLGETYYLQRDYGSALPSLRRALELKPDQPGVEGMLGVSLLALGKAAEAVPHLDRGQVLDALGAALLELGRPRDAVDQLEKALAKRPGDPDILFHLGQAYGRLSRQAFDEVAAGHPDSPRARQIRAEALAASGRSDLAEAEYRDLLRLHPTLPGVRLALGELYLAVGNFEQALEQFSGERGISPGDARAALRRGVVLVKLGRTEEGFAELSEAARRMPDSPEIQYEWGRAADELSNAEVAETAWLRAIALDQSGMWAEQAHYQISRLYRRLDNQAAAERHLEMFQQLQKRRSSPEP